MEYRMCERRLEKRMKTHCHRPFGVDETILYSYLLPTYHLVNHKANAHSRLLNI